MKVYSAVTTWINNDALASLKSACDLTIAKTKPLNVEELKAIAENYDGMAIGRLQHITAEVLEHAKLKFIGLLAKGTANIDLAACKAKGIQVVYTPEANINAVAEHVLTLLLALAKRLPTMDTSVRAEEFDTLRGTSQDIEGRTLGIIGAGPIAKAVIIRAKVFGMHILCHTFHPEKHTDMDVPFVTLENLLQESDFVSVNIPLTAESENMIGYKELSHMKKTAYLINTSRGKVVNEKELVQALQEGCIAGAGIDVFEEEPTHNKDLFALKNVILTPHIAGISKEALSRMEEHLVNDVIALVNRKDPKYRLC